MQPITSVCLVPDNPNEIVTNSRDDSLQVCEPVGAGGVVWVGGGVSVTPLRSECVPLRLCVPVKLSRIREFAHDSRCSS